MKIKGWRIMRLTVILLTVALTQVTARGISQAVTYTGANVPIEKIFSVIHGQTGYTFFYNDQDLRTTKPVTINWKNTPLTAALEESLRGQSLSFVIKGSTIFISLRPVVPSLLPPPIADPPFEVHGRVTDSLGHPLPGASVTVKGSKIGTQTDGDGYFILKNVEAKAVLIVSFTGYGSREVAVHGRSVVDIVLLHIENRLDEIQVIAYGTTTRRLNTGNVSSITAEQIARQPVSNVVGALEGLAPGLSVMQSDGLPGGIYTVVIRGRNSLDNNAPPLYIVDGVPFDGSSQGQFPGTNYESSPLNTISPADIERIDILKDADATAIYGSRGANGVILITSKKGKTGKGGLSINAYTGMSKATRLMKWLTTPQYLKMRREAFKNDGITPTTLNAPDLLVWDTTRNVDWQKLMLGGTAHTDEAQLALTGGTEKTQFRVASTWHHETPVYANSPFVNKRYGYDRGSFAFGLSHTSQDNKFSMGLNAQYTADKSNYSAAVFSEVPLPPDAPNPFDSQGKLVWSEGGASFKNPFALLLNSFDIKNNNLIASNTLSYTLLPGLFIKANIGYNKLENSHIQSAPKVAQNPSDNPVSYSYIVSNQQSSWIVEPQLEYIRKTGIGKFDVLAGATWQNKSGSQVNSNAYNYSSDAFLGTLTGAAITGTQTSSSDYRYNAFYGRLNYDYDEKYLVNLTGRRDGSSRFGPGRQFANFGAIGAAWIITKENWFKDHLGWLSFGKLRGSYGITGSDNIGDYQYVDTWWSYSGYTYDGSIGFFANNLKNPDYAWETNKKLEGALELGFLKDRVLLSASYYRNRAGNQLLNYALPTQTGFGSVLENFPAVVQNSGIEISLNSTNIRTKKFQWSTSFNLTINRNKLITFPGIDSSSYASRYTIGMPITIGRFFQYQGVDPQTGVYTFNGTNYNKDRIVSIDAYGPPRFYGGIDNKIRWKGWDLSLFIQFSKTYGAGYASRMYFYGPPGAMTNQPDYVLNRWQKPGDKASIQRFTTGGSASSAYTTYARNSSASFVSTSFIRFKNISAGYNFSPSLLRTMKIRNMRIYIQGQNLGLITAYKGGDPESQGIGNPLMRVWTGGIQIDF
ncbi:SusC/RagA family TonB-linked outer membrane protein [Flavitalea flava]